MMSEVGKKEGQLTLFKFKIHVSNHQVYDLIDLI